MRTRAGPARDKHGHLKQMYWHLRNLLISISLKVCWVSLLYKGVPRLTHIGETFLVEEIDLNHRVIYK